MLFLDNFMVIYPCFLNRHSMSKGSINILYFCVTGIWGWVIHFSFFINSSSQSIYKNYFDNHNQKESNQMNLLTNPEKKGIESML